MKKRKFVNKRMMALDVLQKNDLHDVKGGADLFAQTASSKDAVSDAFLDEAIKP